MSKIYGLLGESLKHSYSPELHSMLGDNEYRLFEIQPNKVAEFIKSGEFDGFNVTIPYKRTVVPFLAGLSETARRVGCVNTVVRAENGRLYGYNTDVYGFTSQLELSGIEIEGRSCVILGDGGAAAAVRVALENKKAGKIVHSSRSGRNNLVNIEKCSDAEIIINATPVGMYPENGKSPLNLDGMTKLCAVFDLVYNPQKTKLLSLAEALGVPAYNGLTMLVAQAKRSRELFDGTEIDDSVISVLTNKLIAKNRNITLIGMPGCGKTTVGKTLAERLGKKIYDLDAIIERLYGKSPERIIGRYGEAEFRRTEHVAAEWAGKNNGVIISAGGGVVTRADNRLALTQNGIVVFINRSLDKLDTEGRPLSQQTPLEQLYDERLPLYRDWCDIEVDNNGSVDETVDKIITAIDKLS